MQEQQFLKLIIKMLLILHYTQHLKKKKQLGVANCITFSEAYDQYCSIDELYICCTTVIHITRDTTVI